MRGLYRFRTKGDEPARRRALRHAIWTLVPVALVFWWFAREDRQQIQAPSPTGATLPYHRLRWYREHLSECNLLWIGDSRTYCGMDPEVLDPYLGRRSHNLSIWALWFPEQLAFFEDLLPEVPADTTICWSIGHQNFERPDNVLGTQYPLGFARGMRFLWYGYQWKNVRRNLYFHEHALALLRRAESWRQMIEDFMDVPLRAEVAVRPSEAPPVDELAQEDLAPEAVGVPVAAVDPGGSTAASEASVVSTQSSVVPGSPQESLEARAARMMAAVEADPTNTFPKVLTEGGSPTSIEAYTTRGAYRRFEIDHAFFRRKQAERAENLPDDAFAAAEPFEPDPVLWATFERILDVIEASGVDVVVNELEEAPHSYANAAHKEHFRRFMRERVQSAVEAHGLTYVRADLDKLEDTDYFDYNHLNSKGVANYAPLLGEVLRPVLERD